MDFPKTVWGSDRDTPQSEILARYSRALGRHRQDRVLPE